jgi:CubicO group peptidase (beta-lactamase class C family)
MATRHSCRALAVAVLATLASTATGVRAVTDESLPDRIEEIVAAEAAHDLFSGVVLVADRGEIIWARGVGEANREYHILNSVATRFNISSVQKCFIATLILQLNRDGLLSLEDPLIKFFPDCPYETADAIQIRHLLNHSSGLADYRDTDEYRLNSERFRSIDEVLPLVYASLPAFAPGERFEYSNAGVLFLKGIIERVTGQRLSQVLSERIFGPLGMDETVLLVGGTVLENRATGHQRAEDGETLLRVTGEPSAYAGGGIYTTARDLLKFDQAFYGEDLLDEEHKQLMFTPTGPDPAAAYGWFVVPYGGTTVIMHGGGSGGFGTEFRRYPEKGYTIVVQSNWAGAGFELTNAIEALLLGLPYEVASERTAWYRKGMDLQQANQHQRAVEHFERNTTGADPHMPSLYQAARSRILGEFQAHEAIAALDQYIRLADDETEPSVAAAYWRQGLAYEQLGEIPEALACFERSLQHDASFTLAREALARLEAQD